MSAYSPARAFGRWGRSAWACSLGLGLLVALSVQGAVRFDMFPGYDGVVPQGSWFPIEFEVQNDGPSFTARVEVSPAQFNSSQAHVMELELPTGTTKRFVIPTFAGASYNPSWFARLLDAKGNVRAEASTQRLRRLAEPSLPLGGAMTRSLPRLPEMKSRPEESRPVFARLQPTVFPDNPLALEGLDMIYLASERALELKANQVGALLAWVYGGGHLIVGLEQAGHLEGSGDWLKAVLPCTANGMTALAAHPDLQNWLLSRRRFDGLDYDFFADARRGRANMRSTGDANPYARLRTDAIFEDIPLQIVNCEPRGAQVLAGTPAAPLVLFAKRGRGQVTVLAFSPELEPFRSWKNADYFWAKMLDVPPELLQNDTPTRSWPGYSIDGVIGGMIDSEQVRKLPVGWLLLLLIVYLAVIGPFDQFWLKKINRQMLTWLTFPAYVVFFSLLIYFIGYKLRAGETEWTELHFLDVTPHGEMADLRGRSYGSIYSPVNKTYVFGSDEPFATMRGEFSGLYGGAQDASRGMVEQRPAGFRATAAVPVWTSQLFLSDWWRQDTSPVNVKVAPSEVTVDNQLDVALTSVRLAVGGQILELGEVPAQGRKVFPRRNAGTPLITFVQTHSQTFHNAVNSRHQAFGDNTSGRIRDWTNASMAASFILEINPAHDYNSFTAPPGFDLSALVQRGDAVLLAWVPNYSPTQPLNQFHARRERKNTLLRVVVPAG